MPEGDGEASQADIKQGAREAVTIKWQHRWQISEKGRVLYQMKQKVKLKKINFKAQKNQRTILQLQSGYSKLKEYRHKIGTEENPFCKCGEVENVEHYLLHCQEYEGPREKMKQELFLRYGIKHLSVEQFLEEKEDEEETKYTQQEILTILDNHIHSTKRFQLYKKKQQKNTLNKLLNFTKALIYRRVCNLR